MASHSQIVEGCNCYACNRMRDQERDERCERFNYVLAQCFKSTDPFARLLASMVNE